MAYTAPISNTARTSDSRPVGAARRTVDIAGTPWPVYKVEALAVGLLVFVGVLVIVASLQIAVLSAAAATLVVWWAVRLTERPTPTSRT